MSRLCFGCERTSDFSVTNPATPLVSGVEACSAHLGDLLGNVAKRVLPFAQTGVVDLRITRLAPEDYTEPGDRSCTGCGQKVYREPGVGLVSAVHGDNGGTYDVCPERPGRGHLLAEV